MDNSMTANDNLSEVKQNPVEKCISYNWFCVKTSDKNGSGKERKCGRHRIYCSKR